MGPYVLSALIISHTLETKISVILLSADRNSCGMCLSERLGAGSTSDLPVDWIVRNSSTLRIMKLALQQCICTCSKYHTTMWKWSYLLAISSIASFDILTNCWCDIDEEVKIYNTASHEVVVYVLYIFKNEAVLKPSLLNLLCTH